MTRTISYAQDHFIFLTVNVFITGLEKIMIFSKKSNKSDFFD